MISSLVHLVGRVQALLETSRLRVFSSDMAFVEMLDDVSASCRSGLKDDLAPF